MKFVFIKHRLDNEPEATSLHMPPSRTSIPPTIPLLKTNQNAVDKLKNHPNIKKANQRYFYFFICCITVDHLSYSIYKF